MSVSKTFAPANAAATREYLLSAAATLQATLQPDYKGDAAARTRDCAMVLARLALDLGPPSADLLDASANVAAAQGAGRLAAESRARDVLETEAEAIYADAERIAQTPQRAFDRARFEQYIQSHPKGAKTARVVEAKLLQGGRSKLTAFARLEGQGPLLPAEMVVRQDWGKGVPNISVVFEYHIVERVSRIPGLKTAKTILLEESPEPMGAPFMAVSPLAGRIQGNLFSPPKSARMALQLAEQLGRVHALPPADFSGVPNMPRKAYTQDDLCTELEEYRAIYAALDQPNETMNAVFAWLSETSPKAQGPLTLVHGDLGFHNFLVADGDLSAILDWELAHLGNPAEDLGYMRGDIEQMIPWPDFLAAYHAAGGPAFDPFVLDFYTLWSGMHLYCMLLQARAGVAAGLVRDIEIIYCCVNLTPVLLRRMAKQLRAAQAALETSNA